MALADDCVPPFFVEYSDRFYGISFKIGCNDLAAT
jgi:hypothetical protein